MKITKLLKELLAPFLIFVFVGSICPTDDVEPSVCKSAWEDDQQRLYKLDRPQPKSITFKSPNAEAKCDARFFVVFGWQDPVKFASSSELSPMQESFAGLKLTLGETTFGKTFSTLNPVQRNGKSPYEGSTGYLWTIDVPVSSVSTSSSGTQFYVQIEHDILDTDFNFFVEVTIEYIVLQ